MSSQCIHRQPLPNGELQVWDKEDTRSLWFDDVILQSEIDLNDPAVLPNPANRAMLAHLMFGQQPQRVLLAGTGGGGIARWFNARSPQTQGDAIELSPEVAAVARTHFDFPPPDSPWQLHVDDVRQFVVNTSHRYDFILVDLEENQYSPAWVSEPKFLKHCHQALSPQGVLTLNLIPRDAAHYARALSNIRQCFDRQTFSLPVANHDNQLILAFKIYPKQTNTQATIEAAAKLWGLPFARYAKALI